MEYGVRVRVMLALMKNARWESGRDAEAFVIPHIHCEFSIPFDCMAGRLFGSEIMHVAV